MEKQGAAVVAGTSQVIGVPPLSALKRNWLLYVYEAIELALFMISHARSQSSSSIHHGSALTCFQARSFAGS
jgi:hypothetical protein